MLAYKPKYYTGFVTFKFLMASNLEVDFGNLAQSVEHRLDKAMVAGSNPAIPTNALVA